MAMAAAMRGFAKTAAMAAASYVGDSEFFALDYLLRFMRVAVLLAGRIVMIDRGRITFDGDFLRLRSEFGDRRRLLIETPPGPPPVLEGAELVESIEGRHEFVFDAAQVGVAALLDQAAEQVRILDVETHRAPIDVIADIYAHWQKT